jgi:hypothetical protein
VIDRRRRADLAKLDAMQKYAYNDRLPPRLCPSIFR